MARALGSLPVAFCEAILTLAHRRFRWTFPALGVAMLIACSNAGSTAPNGGSGGTGGSSGTAGASASGGAGGVAGQCGSADTSSDPHNCGACGHDCFGGACQAGVCGPAVVFTSGKRDLFGLGIATDAAYVIDDLDDLQWSPLPSGTLNQLVPGNTTAAYVHFSVDAKNVYWAKAGTALVATDRATGATRTLAAAGTFDIADTDVVQFAGGLYFEYGTDRTSGAGGVLARYDPAQGTTNTLVALDSAFDASWRSIFATATTLVWTDTGKVSFTTGVGQPVVDLPVTPLTGTGVPFQVVADDSAFYVLEQEGDNSHASLRRLTRDGKSTVLVPVSGDSPTEVAVDDDYVYLLERPGTNAYHAHVILIAKKDGASRVFFDDPTQDGVAIAADGKSLFVLEDTRLMRIAKPL